MQVIDTEIRGKKFKFWTQAGIFSKEKIDKGTQLLLENIEISNRARVLDLGCGYGVMGIIAALLCDGSVVLVDSDIRAVRLTEKNLQENGVKNGIVIISDGFSDLEGKKFDLILTYPPSHEGKEVIENFVKGASDHIMKTGKFYLVTEKRLKNYFKRLLNENFKENEIVKESNGYILFLGKN